MVEYVKLSEHEQTDEVHEQPSTSTSSGFEISTCVAYVNDINNGETQMRDKQLKVIQASLEIKFLESEIEKLLFTRSEVKNCENRIATLCQVLILLSKDIVEEELQKKKDSECEPEDKMIETNAEEKEKEKKTRTD